MPGSDLSHDGGAVPPPVDPWDRRETEPEHSYGWFRAYLALGAGRTLDELADRLDRPKHLLDQVRRAWHWDHRASAWDRHIAASLSAARHAARDRAAGRATSAALAALETAEAGIANLDLAKIGPTAAAELLNAGTNAARWAVGDPNDYRPGTADDDPLTAIAHDPSAALTHRVRASVALEKRDAAEEAAEADRDIISAVQEALGSDDPDRARRVSAALSGHPVAEPGSSDDDRPDLAADLDQIMKDKE